MDVCERNMVVLDVLIHIVDDKISGNKEWKKNALINNFFKLRYDPDVFPCAEKDKDTWSRRLASEALSEWGQYDIPTSCRLFRVINDDCTLSFYKLRGLLGNARMNIKMKVERAEWMQCPRKRKLLTLVEKDRHHT